MSLVEPRQDMWPGEVPTEAQADRGIIGHLSHYLRDKFTVYLVSSRFAFGPVRLRTQSNFLCSDVPTMPIVDKLKEALKPGRKETGDEGDLNKLLASSAKKVLLQKIEFEPASKGFSYQLDSLKNKYVILNPRNEGATGQKVTEPAQIKRQGKRSN